MAPRHEDSTLDLVNVTCRDLPAVLLRLLQGMQLCEAEALDETLGDDVALGVACVEDTSGWDVLGRSWLVNGDV